jgi:hypothetical protein
LLEETKPATLIVSNTWLASNIGDGDARYEAFVSIGKKL